MGNRIVFEDYSAKILAEIQNKSDVFLEEVGGEIESKAADFTRVASGQTRRDWGHTVNSSALEVTIGNNNENAIWEEFGTGEYAVKGNGRKGGWWIAADSLDPKTRSLFETKYHFRKGYGKGGKLFYYTRGKKGTEALNKALQSGKGIITAEAIKIFKGLND